MAIEIFKTFRQRKLQIWKSHSPSTICQKLSGQEKNWFQKASKIKKARNSWRFCWELAEKEKVQSEPSKADLEITKRILEAGKIMGIDVLDHIIITKTKIFSLKKEKLI